MSEELPPGGDELPAMTAAQVGAAAALVRLPLGQDRLGPVADLLNAWLPMAEALSERMRDPALLSLMPAVTFTSPVTETKDGT